MKIKHLQIVLFLLLYSPALFAGEWEEISLLSTKSLSVKLEWRINNTDKRTNRDGSLFYYTEIRISYNNGDKISTYVVPDHVYTNGDLNGGMTPCMIIDPTQETVTIFVLEKDASSGDYGMTGYAYFLSKGKDYFVRETVFSRANCGWFPFFGGSNNGNPTLCHFSFSGYTAMESTRNSNGTWSNYTVGSIKPDVASQQLKTHKNILITSESNVDKMSGIPNRSRNPIANAGANSTGKTLYDDKNLGPFGLGLLSVASAINKGLESLPANSGGSIPNESYTSSDNFVDPSCTITVKSEGTIGENKPYYIATINNGSKTKTFGFYYQESNTWKSSKGYYEYCLIENERFLGETLDEAKEKIRGIVCKELY